MSENFSEKVDEIKKIFQKKSAEEIYAILIQMGRELEPMSDALKTPENRVSGCQSALHLHSELKNEKMFFQASGDALISAGLAALLIALYNGQSCVTILKEPVTFLRELGIEGSLSPSRSNGLYQIHLRMKRDALKFLI